MKQRSNQAKIKGYLKFACALLLFFPLGSASSKRLSNPKRNCRIKCIVKTDCNPQKICSSKKYCSMQEICKPTKMCHHTITGQKICEMMKKCLFKKVCSFRNICRLYQRCFQRKHCHNTCSKKQTETQPNLRFHMTAKTGSKVDTGRFKQPISRWFKQVVPDSRAGLQVPVVFVRIYSNRRKAEQIAPKKWLKTLLQLSNQLFRYPAHIMERYNKNKLAPIVQFKLHRIYDVHEKEVSRILGMKMDTENLLGGSSSHLNGHKLVSTRDLRRLKVNQQTEYLTIFCVWDGKNTSHNISRFGGESNIGFADQPKNPRSILTEVSSIRAKMGVVLVRWKAISMRTLAHELGHYFGLHHAWQRKLNQKKNIHDIGFGPKNNVDPRPNYGNAMDYDTRIGGGIWQYFTHQQLDYMYKFALNKASTQITIHRQGQLSVAKHKPSPAKPNPDIKIVSAHVETKPGGKITVSTHFHVNFCVGKQLQVVVWFQDQNGQKLFDTDGRFRTGTGHVAMGKQFTPRYVKTLFKSFKLSLPSGQLHLPPGNYKLQARLAIFRSGKVLAKYKTISFHYTILSKPMALKTSKKRAAWITDLRLKTTPLKKRPLTITADITANHLKNQPLYLEARFYFASGKPLRDFNGKYRSPNGFVFTQTQIKPRYKRARIRNIKLSIPYLELHLRRDIQIKMKVELCLRWKKKCLISRMSRIFTIQPQKQIHAAAALPQRAQIKKVRLFSYGEGIRRKLKIQTQISIQGLQGKHVEMIAWIYDSNGSLLRDKDGRFRTRTGFVAIQKTLHPKYGKTLFRKTNLFIPYAQFHLPKGTHQIKIVIKLYTSQIPIAQHSVLFWVRNNI